MKLLAALLLVSCGPAAPEFYACRSACGLLVEYPVSQQWCTSLQTAEDRTLKAFVRIALTDARFGGACSALQDYTVEVLETPSFVRAWDRYHISGQTSCDIRRIVVGSDLPARGALPHELAHAVQRCQPQGPIAAVDPDHSNWEVIYAELEREGLSW